MVRLRVGCSGWSYPEWVGPFYPRGTRQIDFLNHYARAFDTVEVDSSFYRVPTKATVAKWAQDTPEGFLFCPKLPQEVTGGERAGGGEKSGRTPADAHELLAEFLEVVDGLGAKLGPLVAQFAPSYARKGHEKAVERLMEAIGPRRAGYEFRHPSWFDPSTYEALRGRNGALVWSELSGVEVPPEVTSKTLLVRFIGDRSFDPAGKVVRANDGALGRWAGRMEDREQHVDEAFVFFNNHFEGFGPGSANRFLSALGRPTVDWAAAIAGGGRAQRKLGEF